MTIPESITPSALAWLLLAVFALTVILRKVRESREEASKWVLESDAFKAHTEKQKAAISQEIAEESEKTRDLVRTVHAEILREIAHLRETHAPRPEFEQWKGRVCTLEEVNKMHHGTAIPHDSGSFCPGNLGT